jgi:hypothetical protein
MKPSRVAAIAGVVLAGSMPALGAGPIANGDVNGDGHINITDTLHLLNWQFLGGPPPIEIARVSLAPSEGELRPERHEDAAFSRVFFPSDCHWVSAGAHPFFRLEPGFRVTLAGEDDGEEVRVVTTVLDELRSVSGVMTRVVEEREWVDRELVEVSRSFLALCEQSGDLSIFGEEFEEVPDEGIDELPWEVGVDGAQAGVLLPGSPIAGARYYQEIAPGIAMDRAEIIGIAPERTVGGRRFENVLLIYETTPLEPQAGSLKLYAPGIGLVKDGPLEVVDYGFVGGTGEPEEFESLRIAIELNETDGDAEILFSASAPEGLRSLSVVSPSGAQVIELEATGAEPLEPVEFHLECGEASSDDIGEVFPQGTFHVEARGVSGRLYAGEAFLSHDLLPAPSISITPARDPEAGPTCVSWEPVEGAAAYLVEIENESLGAELTATLPAAEACFEVPAGFLLPGTEYKVGVATVSATGNLAVAERELRTAEPR